MNERIKLAERMLTESCSVNKQGIMSLTYKKMGKAYISNHLDLHDTKTII